MRIAMAVLTTVLLGACGKREVPVEHVKYNAKADLFELGVTDVASFRNRAPTGDGFYMPDVNHLEGDNVVVHGGGQLLLNLCRLGSNANTISRSEFYELGIIIAPGPVNLQTGSRLNGTYYATEHDSLSMLTAYVNFDNVRNFYHDVLLDRTPATETRAELAFYGDLALGCGNGRIGLGLPLSSTDNAAYVSSADLFIILRDNVFPTGVELGSNPGVAAHEYGHRIFQHHVYGSEAAFRLLAISILGSQTEKDNLCLDEVNSDNIDCKASSLQLKGMDEGTADVLAYTFTGKPGFFFERSVDPKLGITEATLRDLSGKPVAADGELPIYDERVRAFAADGSLQFYRLGTLWARGYYASIVDPRTGNPPADEAQRHRFASEHYGPAVLRAEDRLGQDFTAATPTRQFNYRFDPRQFLRRYIEEASRDPVTGADLPAVRDSLCRQMCDRFGAMAVDQILNNAPAQCSGVIGTNEFSMTLLGIFPCTL